MNTRFWNVLLCNAVEVLYAMHEEVVYSKLYKLSLYEKKVVIKHVILDESLRLYGQAFKRAWWMPWQSEAMKDVVGYEKPRGAVKHALIRGYPNGETHLIYQVSLTE